MAYEGLEILVDSAVARGRKKRKCWSQLSTGAYGRKAVFRPSRLNGTKCLTSYFMLVYVEKNIFGKFIKSYPFFGIK